jgi:hypothetical protein
MCYGIAVLKQKRCLLLSLGHQTEKLFCHQRPPLTLPHSRQSSSSAHRECEMVVAVVAVLQQEMRWSSNM